MNDFIPHNLVDLLALAGALLGVAKYFTTQIRSSLLNNVKKPIEELSKKLDRLEIETSDRLDAHERRLNRLEGD